MANGRRIRCESNIYHLVCRGSGKQIIFEDDQDRRRYYRLLLTAFSSKGAAQLLAWCLMDNHVHLLVEADMDEISTQLQIVNSAYARYFNERYGRVGHLFQGRFKSEPINSDEYLLVALRYIHQNPVKAGMASDCSYPWSSFSLYREASCLTDAQKRLLSLCGGRENFEAFHDCLDYAAPCKDIGRGRKRIDDGAALKLANRLLCPLSVTDVLSLKKQERNAALVQLRMAGLSIRQIERLTGVSKTIVAEARAFSAPDNAA